MNGSRRTRGLTAAALGVLLVPAAAAPVRSYDFFWHLATGRWIFEHRALPLFDPFALATDRTPWINGEWLFQWLLYAVFGSPAHVAAARAVCVAAMFAAICCVAARKLPLPVAAALACLAFAGGWDHLDARPSTAAAGLLAAAIVLLQRPGIRSDVAYVVLTVIWVNVHPSALLAPLLALLFRRIHWLPLASAAALVANPFGVRGIVAPLELMRFAGSGAFVNAEWLPSRVGLFPLLYVTIAIAALAFVLARGPLAEAVAAALVAYLAIAHVRNQGLYFAAFALLVAPAAALALDRCGNAATRAIRSLSWIATAAAIGFVFLTGRHSLGVDADRFPVAAVQRLEAAHLAGNIYNPDQFGGFLIWATYPQRRVLTDGRNELYHRYIAEYAAARTDSRAWHALLRRYRIDLAVDEYRPLLDVVDPRSGAHRSIPASLAYWPRQQWALIAYDRAGMVFARRAAFAPAVIERFELKGVVPDAQGR